MAFSQQKTEALNNLMASECVGDVDEVLTLLLTAINGLPDYYTTSSCGGRVVLMQDLGRKGLNSFPGKWHRKVSLREVLDAMIPCDGTLWFRYECPIIHVVARTTERASGFLHLCRESGFKRSGIQALKEERILIEVLSTERIDSPVMADGVKLVSDEYLSFLVKQANLKYDAGLTKLKRIEEKIKELG